MFKVFIIEIKIISGCEVLSVDRHNLYSELITVDQTLDKKNRNRFIFFLYINSLFHRKYTLDAKYRSARESYTCHQLLFVIFSYLISVNCCENYSNRLLLSVTLLQYDFPFSIQLLLFLYQK